ncbi:phosphatidylglycerol lysyltransferase domain-containing protein [Pseudonocardia sp. ICBG162]|uniref:phosphatidylglycerol lysyltransferase domain-containing protein n=1 Tax=Pseudonocardia sp. ICBG162 TaxID=2846761 RepID=UPI001CF6515F|nr:phosphatidylglycerol lysyltransferase domain-containing protein [Pseudonocardia sp. ICBG162]
MRTKLALQTAGAPVRDDDGGVAPTAPARAAGDDRPRHTPVRTLSALVVALAAVACLVELSAAFADAGTVVDRWFWFVGIPTGPSVVVGLALALLAAALRAGKRAAWLALVSFLALAAAGELVLVLAGEAEPVDLIVPAVWAALLAARRGEFAAHVAPGAHRRAAAVLVTGLGGAVGVGWLVAPWVGGAPGAAGPRLVWVLDRLTGGTFELVAGGPGGGWLTPALDVVGGAVLLGALAVFLRGARAHGVATADDELRVRALVAAHGGPDSLAWFATRRDKRVVFAPDGRAAVAYRVVAGASVAAGDPVGSVDGWPAAVSAWLAEAHRFGWQPVVLAAGERGAAVYRRYGLRVRRIGDEAVVDLARLARTGGREGRVRRAVRRLDGEGYRVTVRRVRDVPAADLDAIDRRAERWRDSAIERGFSMASGRVADPSDPDVLLVEAFGPDDVACGLLTFAPWGSDGLSLDVMRRGSHAPAGLTEFMIGKLAAVAPTLGVRRASLNFVVFRETLETGARLGAGPGQRTRRTVLRGVSSFVQIESLHRFSRTFEPDWVPRLLCWSGGGVRAVVAAGVAEGFLRPSGVGRRAAARRRDDRFRARALGIGTPGDTAGRSAERARSLALAPLVRPAGEVDDVAALQHRHAELGRDVRTGEPATVVGRVRAQRTFGALAFATLRSGPARIQVIVEAATVGPETLARWKDGVEPDDLVLVSGEVVTSRSGELSVLLADWQVLAAPVRPGRADPLADAAERTLLAAGFSEVAVPPTHPALPGAPGPGPDGAPERVYHLERSPSGPVLHLRVAPADAATARGILDTVLADLPGEPVPGRTGVVEDGLPVTAVPLARPRARSIGTADAWRVVVDGRDVAEGAAGRTDAGFVERVLGPGPVSAAFERGVLPFATLRADLAALAGATIEGPQDGRTSADGSDDDGGDR